MYRLRELPSTQGGSRPNSGPKLKPRTNPTEKECSKCKQVLPADSFYKSTKSPDGLQGHCKPCRQVHPDLTRKWSYKTNYGLTIEDYNLMLEKQEGVCAVCGNAPKDGNHLHIDHCHETGAIRGLLCLQCNAGIGQLKDDPVLLENALNYLRENNGTA